jgi:hypothetical protein
MLVQVYYVLLCLCQNPRKVWARKFTRSSIHVKRFLLIPEDHNMTCLIDPDQPVQNLPLEVSILSIYTVADPIHLLNVRSCIGMRKCISRRRCIITVHE